MADTPDTPPAKTAPKKSVGRPRKAKPVEATAASAPVVKATPVRKTPVRKVATTKATTAKATTSAKATKKPGNGASSTGWSAQIAPIKAKAGQAAKSATDALGAVDWKSHIDPIKEQAGKTAKSAAGVAKEKTGTAMQSLAKLISDTWHGRCKARPAIWRLCPPGRRIGCRRGGHAGQQGCRPVDERSARFRA